MLLSSPLMRGIAGWRLAICIRTDWVSLSNVVFWGHSSVWIICNAFLISFFSARKDEQCVPAGMA